MKKEYIDQYGIDSLPNLIMASQHKIKIFVTINKGLLKDRKELEKKFNIIIRSPGEALNMIKMKSEI